MSSTGLRAAHAAAMLIGLVAARGAAQQAPLVTLTGDEPGDDFGRAIAAAGDVNGDGVMDVIVGAPKADAGGDRRGKAHVFSGADFSLLHLFVGSGDKHELGSAVDGAGDVNGDGHADVIVGEPWPGSGSETLGRASVFSGADGSLLHLFVGLEGGDAFGEAVAGVGDLNGDGYDDVAVSGSDYGCATSGIGCTGRLVVYSGLDGSVLWEKLGQPGFLHLGTALDGCGDVNGDGVQDLVVGDGGWKGTAPVSVGAVLVLSGTGGGLLRIGPGVYDGLPGSMSFARTAGALGDVNGDGIADFWGGGEDVVRVFSGADGAPLHVIESWTDTWDGSHAADVGDVDGDGRDEFVVGDPEAPAPPGKYSGHLRFYDGATAQLQALLRGVTSGGRLGTALAALGDRDADGQPEILAGEPSLAGVAAGRALVFELRPDPPVHAVVEDDALQPTWFGLSVAAAGDVDNDGAPDVIAGEPLDSTIPGQTGRARVFSGRDGSVLHTFLGDFSPDMAGWAVDGAGDLDRDGYADVVVALPFRKPPFAGAVRAYTGRTGALLFQANGDSYGDRFGLSVAGMGDVNGDLVPDVLVGAPLDDVGAPDAGAAYLLSGADGSRIWSLRGAVASASFGWKVAGGGDVDHDGVPDLLVGVPNEPVGMPVTFPGVVRVFSGATGQLLHVLAGVTPGGGFGQSLADARDVDGDGHADIVVGSPSEGVGGAVAMHSGATGAQLWKRVWKTECNAGQAVASFGDLDGDGIPDLLVGGPMTTQISVREGEVQVLSGADGSLLAAFLRPVEDAHLGVCVDELGDLDLDGRPDVLASAEYAFDGALNGSFATWLVGPGNPAWENLGKTLPGIAGAPTLLPNGSLQAGSSVSFALRHAAPSSTAGLVVGFAEAQVPFKGGTLVPMPQILLLGLPTNADGELVLSATWPTSLPPGFSIWWQYWIVDATAVAGLSASNAVKGTTP
jgi:hypothetical protein